MKERARRIHSVKDYNTIRQEVLTLFMYQYQTCSKNRDIIGSAVSGPGSREENRARVMEFLNRQISGCDICFI